MNFIATAAWGLLSHARRTYNNSTSILSKTGTYIRSHTQKQPAQRFGGRQQREQSLARKTQGVRGERVCFSRLTFFYVGSHEAEGNELEHREYEQRDPCDGAVLPGGGSRLEGGEDDQHEGAADEECGHDLTRSCSLD